MAAKWSSIRPATILGVGAVLAIAYGYPGYMNFDSAEQLHQARTGVWDDWHPPIMARYWHASERLIHGPLPLLILQISLFVWGAYGLLKRRFQPRTAAVMAVALLWFPPVLAPLGVVWKDAQMAGWLMAGFMLATGPTWRSRLGGLMLLVMGAAVRDNGCAALPPLLLVVAASWGFRRKLVICAIGFAMFVAITGTAFYANKKISMGPSFAWWKANAIHDIAGTICHSDPMTDDEVRAELVGIPLRQTENLQQRMCEQYNPRWWFGLSFDAKGLFATQPDQADRDARRAAYFRVIGDHPGGFLDHRWLVTKELLGASAEPPDEPVCQTFAGAPSQLKPITHDASLSFFQRVTGRKLVKLSKTLLFRPWAYVAFGLILFGYAVWRRDGLVVAILGSGFLYETSFAVGAAGAAFRYSHWMIACVCLATAIVFVDRFREGQASVRISKRQPHV